MSELDPRICYQALLARDERFDGRVFVGVTSTGIYCRPVCPARPARFDHCRFYRSAAAAQAAGFRPCLRCRPETAPDLGAWNGTSNTVLRALALIAAGALDGQDASIDALADRLGVGARQLRRLFRLHLGASPVAVAQTHRVLFAKQLVHETRLSMAEIALAAGFGSIRRYNEVFRKLFRRPPGVLRRDLGAELPEGSISGTGVTVRLRYRAPYDWEAMLSYLRARAVEGVEHVSDEAYARTVVEGGVTGSIEVVHMPECHAVAATIRLPSVSPLPAVVARVRRAFDLAADVVAIGAHLARDPLLKPLVTRRPGLRVPGGWDGFEAAVRAILGQQVSVEAGRRLAGQLTRMCGTELPGAGFAALGLTRTFPSAAQVAGVDLGALGMPNARRQALVAVARAAIDDPFLFESRATLPMTVARLCTIRGIGEWTAHSIALRAARDPDAFPSGDVALLRGAAAPTGVRPTPAGLLQRAEPWRPWRAYAAQHLWTADTPSRPTRAPGPR